MSDWTILAWCVLGLLVFNAVAVIGVSRWGQHMAAKNQILQLDRELDQHMQETTR